MTGGSWQSKTGLSLQGQNLLPNSTVPVGQVLSPAVPASSLGFGTGPGTISIIVSQSYVIPANSSITLDLFDGSLPDVLGSPATFRVLRAYAIWVASGGDQNGLTIGGAGSNPHPLFFGSTSATKTIYPGGPEDAGGTPLGPGVAVTSTACNVKLTNNSAIPLTVAVNFTGSQCRSGSPIGLFPMLTYP